MVVSSDLICISFLEGFQRKLDVYGTFIRTIIMTVSAILLACLKESLFKMRTCEKV